MRRLAGTLLATIPLALLLMAAPAAGSVSRDPSVPAPGIAVPTAAPSPAPVAPAGPVSPPGPAAPTPPSDPASTVEGVVGSLPGVQSLLGQLGLFGAPASPDTLSPGASDPSSSAPSRAESAASAGDATEASSIARRALRARHMSAVTGTAALLRVALSATPLIALLIAAVVFLLVQGRLDRRAPQLVSAPLDRRQHLLEFS